MQLRTPEELAARRALERSRGRALRARPRTEGPSSIAYFAGGIVAIGFVVLGLADGGFEPAVWAQASILVWWACLVALAAGAWPRSPVPAAAAVAGGCLFALTALTGLSLAWATDLGAAYEDALRGAGYLGVFVLVAIAARAGEGRAVLAGLATGLVAVATLALISRLEPGFTGGPDEANGLIVSGGRLSYPLGYWNGLAACMAAALPLLLWLAAGAATRGRRALAGAAIPICFMALYFSGSRGGGIATAAAIGVLLLAGPRRVTLAAITAVALLAGTIVSGVAAQTPELVNGAQNETAAAAGDRVLVLTIVASLAVAALIGVADRAIARVRLPVIGVRRAAIGAAIVLILGLAAINPGERLDTLDDPPATQQATGSATRFQSTGSSGRVQFWETALDALESEPLRGIGAGGYEAFWAQNGSLDFIVTHAHSLFLEGAAELGPLAPLLALGLFAAPALAGVRRLRSPIAWSDPDAAGGAIGAALAVLAAGIAAAAFDWVWDLPAAFVPTIIAAAFLCVPPARTGHSAEPGRARAGGSRRSRVAALLAVGAAGVAAIAAAGALLMSELALDESERAVAEGRLHEAAASAEDATGWVPFAADPYRRLALVEHLRERPSAARVAIEEAQERAEQDWRLWYTEAGIELADDRAGAGLYALNRARELNPKAPRSLFAFPSALSVSTETAPAEASGEG